MKVLLSSAGSSAGSRTRCWRRLSRSSTSRRGRISLSCGRRGCRRRCGRTHGRYHDRHTFSGLGFFLLRFDVGHFSSLVRFFDVDRRSAVLSVLFSGLIYRSFLSRCRSLLRRSGLVLLQCDLIIKSLFRSTTPLHVEAGSCFEFKLLRIHLMTTDAMGL
jgi:hypothetical protein